MESEFGTSVDEEVIKIILEKGTLQASEVSLLSYNAHSQTTSTNQSVPSSSPSVKAPRTIPWEARLPTKGAAGVFNEHDCVAFGNGFRQWHGRSTTFGRVPYTLPLVTERDSKRQVLE